MFVVVVVASATDKGMDIPAWAQGIGALVAMALGLLALWQQRQARREASRTALYLAADVYKLLRKVLQLTSVKSERVTRMHDAQIYEEVMLDPSDAQNIAVSGTLREAVALMGEVRASDLPQASLAHAFADVRLVGREMAAWMEMVSGEAERRAVPLNEWRPVLMQNGEKLERAWAGLEAAPRWRVATERLVTSVEALRLRLGGRPRTL